MEKIKKFWRKNAVNVYGTVGFAALCINEPDVSLVAIVLALGTMIRNPERWGKF